MNNPEIIKQVKNNISIKNSILQELELYTDSKERNIYNSNLYNKIIVFKN